MVVVIHKMSFRLVRDSVVDTTRVGTNLRIPIVQIDDTFTSPNPLEGLIAYNDSDATNSTGKIWYADGFRWYNLSSSSPTKITIPVVSTGAFPDHDFEVLFSTIEGSEHVDMIITDTTAGSINTNDDPQPVVLPGVIPVELRPSQSFWKWGIGHAKNGMTDIWITIIMYIKSNGDIEIYNTSDGSSATLWPGIPVLYPINFYTNQVGYSIATTTAPPA